ncbi:MAG: hypothetical protein GY820_25165 [Gammaproteobacteria bacterium]|nr:hypothetical protein [Gammaproteobacteria bacterium]
MNKYIVGLILLFITQSALSASVCIDVVNIKELKPRSDGWMHIVAEGVSDIDIMNCGTNNSQGMLLNFNDSSGTQEGKKMMLSILLSAFVTGKSMQICSNGCDSQHPSYSRLDIINNLQ